MNKMLESAINEWRDWITNEKRLSNNTILSYVRDLKIVCELHEFTLWKSDGI